MDDQTLAEDTTPVTSDNEIDLDTSREDSLLDPLRSIVSGVNFDDAGGSGGSNALGDRLSGAFDESEDAFAAALAAELQPRIKKVTDPVAFMTSAKKDVRGQIKYSQGSYDIAIQNLDAENGFYELAKAECAALADTVSAELASGRISTVEARGFSNLVFFLESYHSLYSSLQVSGNVYVWQKKAEESTKEARASITTVRTALRGVPDSVLGEVIGSVEQCLNEMELFVDSWQSVANTSKDGTNASTNMAKLFLQTNERVRNQLNAYDKLEERGGDATGTANKRISDDRGYTISDGDQAEAQIQKEGGYMAVALKSYGLEPEQERLRDIQMQAVLKRLKAGEWSTEEEFIQAFQQEVGGGATSRAYMAKLKHMGQGFWNAVMGQGEADSERAAYESGNSSVAAGNTAVGAIDRRIVARDDQAKSREDNRGNYDNMTDEMRQIAERSGLLSVQEQGRLDMDQKASDEAYDNALRFQAMAQKELARAKGLLADTDDKLAAGLDHHSRALQFMAQAKMHSQFVTGTKDKALVRGLAALNADIQTVENTLIENEALRKELIAKRNQLESLIEARAANLESYNPERLVVPAPEVSMAGQKLENESFIKLALDLTGPAWGVFWWMGGLEGQLSDISTWDEKDGEDWLKASIQIYGGLKANLWLVELGVKVTGFFDAQKKQPTDLLETLAAGAEEVFRWAYAGHHNLGSMGQEIGTVMNVGQRVGEKVYTDLQDAVAEADSVSQLAKNIATADSQMRQLHSGLRKSLTSVYDSGGTKIDSKAISEMADDAVPVDDIVESFANIRRASDLSEVQERLITDKGTFSSNISDTRTEVVNDIKKIDPGQNNPDVQVSAGVKVEGFVGAGLGSVGKASFSAARVWTFTDGTDESFNFNHDTKTVYTGKVEFNMASGATMAIQVTGEPKSEKDGGGWEIGIEGDIPVGFKENENVKGQEIIESLQEFAKGQKHVAKVDKWIESLPKKMYDSLMKADDSGQAGMERLYAVSSTSTTFIKVGGSFHVADSSVKKWSVKFGVIKKRERGSKFGSISAEVGNIVTYTSEQAKQAKVDEAALKKEKALAQDMTGTPNNPVVKPDEQDEGN